MIRFNQPDRLNGMTQGMKRDLIETLLQAQMDDAVRIVLFTGSGRAFSAGDDISGKPPSSGEAQALVPPIPGGHHNPIGTYDGLRALSQPLNRAVRELDKLSIAAINGVAIQTGFSLALSCDFRIASTEARMGSGTLRFGLMPDEGGQYLLVQAMGVPKTIDFLMRTASSPARRRSRSVSCTKSCRPASSKPARWIWRANSRPARKWRCACSSARSTTRPS